MKWQTLIPELIYEILDQCRADCKILSVDKPGSFNFPWYLGHICRAWREVFVSSPLFWSTLSIYLDFSIFSPRRVQSVTVLEVARIAIVRSGNCPISFRLTAINCKYSDTTLCREIIKILVANSARWFDAYMYIPTTEMAIVYLAKGHMPLLRSIQLALSPQAVGNTIFWASELHNDFLMGTTLTRISFYDYSPFWKINWSLITVVHFGIVPPFSQLLAYLSQMPCVMELAFLNLNNCKRDRDGIVPVHLPHLKSLYSSAAFLAIIDTPALQELYIWNNIPAMFENSRALKAIIPRYFQPIRHLQKLGITGVDCKEAAMIIEHMPRVDHLTLASECNAEIIEILKDYPQTLGFLTTVTFVLESLDTSEQDRDHLLETIMSWKRGTGENRGPGIGPFHNLTKMSFTLLNGYRQLADGLKLHLEEQGMTYSISEHIEDHFFSPQFDVL